MRTIFFFTFSQRKMSKKCSPAFAFQKCFCKGEFIHSALFRTILTRLWGNPTCILRAFVYWVRNTFGLYRGFSLKGKLGFIFEHPKKVDNFKEWNNKLCAIERNELYPFQGVGCEQSLAGVWKTVKKKWIHPVFKKFNWTQSYRNLLETRWNPVWAHCLNVQTLLIDYLLLLHISVSDILLKGVLGTRVKYSLSADFYIQSGRKRNRTEIISERVLAEHLNPQVTRDHITMTEEKTVAEESDT